MNINHIKIGSRGSELAMYQSNWIKSRLEELFPRITVEVVQIQTTGDKILDSPLSKIGDKGLFIKEIEYALLDRSIDLAVHSLKDIPTNLPDGLTIGAVTKREDVHDVFVAHPAQSIRTLRDVPMGSFIATGSLRRKSQLLALRPDLSVVELRGNLNTRLKKLEESDWAGIILAKAGLVRLGLQYCVSEELSFEWMLPAVGQGALAVEIRTKDEPIQQIVQGLNHWETEIATSAERALLRCLEGGCQIPIGAYGRIEEGEFLLDAMIGQVEGKKIVRGTIKGFPDNAEELGTHLAETLRAGGGDAILKEVRESSVEAIPSV